MPGRIVIVGPSTGFDWYEEDLPRDVDLTDYFGYDRYDWLPVDFNFCLLLNAKFWGIVCRGLSAFGRDFMLFDGLMIAFMDEPEWVEEMMDFQTNFIIRLWKRALSDVEVVLCCLARIWHII